LVTGVIFAPSAPHALTISDVIVSAAPDQDRPVALTDCYGIGQKLAERIREKIEVLE
jgi:ribosomal protein S13